MLRKLALAVGAVAFCGAVQSQAAFYSSHDKGGQYGGDSYKGDEGDKEDCFKIIVPELDSNDLVKWIQTLDFKQSHGNVFDELVNGYDPKDLGFCLPKSETKILDDIRSDIKDVEKDFDKLDKDGHGSKDDGHKSDGHDKYSSKDGHDDHDTKEVGEDITWDLTDIRHDICQFADGLKDDCHPCPSTPVVVPSTSAVPPPAAASQGLVGLALVGRLLTLSAPHAVAFSLGPVSINSASTSDSFRPRHVAGGFYLGGANHMTHREGRGS